jgi:hypothetical protein
MCRILDYIKDSDRVGYNNRFAEVLLKKVED